MEGFEGNNNTISVIETIYFSANVDIDWNALTELKDMFDTYIKSDSCEDGDIRFDVGNGYIEMLPYSVLKRYPYMFRYIENDNTDIRICFARKNTNNFPIYVLISSQFLWRHSVEHCIEISKILIRSVLDYFNQLLDNPLALTITTCQMSRWDYAHHTNLISNLDSWLPYDQVNALTVTRLKLGPRIPVRVGAYGVETTTVYFGQTPIKIRIYDKPREIIEQQYKGFFFELWYKEGLIDKWECDIFKRAYELGRNFDGNIRYSLIEMLQRDYKFIKDLDLHCMFSDFFDRFKKGYNIVELFDQIVEYLNSKYSKSYSLPRKIYNFEVEVRRKFLKSVLKNEFLEAFEKDSVTDNLNSVEDYERILGTFKIFDLEVLQVENFINKAQLIKDTIMQNVFRVIVPDTATWKKDCDIDPVYMILANTQISYLDGIEQDMTKIVKKDLHVTSVVKNVKRGLGSMANVGYLTNMDIPTRDEFNSDYDYIQAVKDLFHVQVDFMFDVSENNIVHLEKLLESRRRRFRNSKTNIVKSEFSLKALRNNNEKNTPRKR